MSDTTSRKIEMVDPVTEAETRALAIANDFRKAIGEPTITGLIPGQPGNATSCILARTFNADCKVGYDNEPEHYDEDTDEYATGDLYGTVSFKAKNHAEAFAAAVNAHRLPEDDEAEVDERLNLDYAYEVKLTSPVAQIASDFDATALENQSVLDERYYDWLNPEQGGAMIVPVNDVLGLAALAKP